MLSFENFMLFTHAWLHLVRYIAYLRFISSHHLLSSGGADAKALCALLRSVNAPRPGGFNVITVGFII